MTTSGISTGYYGVPGGYGGKVHLHQNGKPMCGTRLAAGSQFQWCARGIVERFLECKRCQQIADDKLYAAFKERVTDTNPCTLEGQRLRRQLAAWRKQRS